jgi:phage terminase large subunit
MNPEKQLEAITKFQKEPEHFFAHILGAEPEAYQARILRTIAENQRTAISACHDVGKSWTLARIVLWFLSCHPNSKAITTAPTFNQVKNILWSEIRSAHSKSKFPLGGKMLQTEWQLSKDGDWFGIGFTPRNEVTSGEGQGTQSSFQGFHAEGGILVVFDEATGVPPNIWTMAEGLLTQAHVKFVAIGNPTSRNSEFFRCFKSRDWAKVHLSCFDSPNLIANGITDINKLTAEIDLLRSLSDAEIKKRMHSYVAPKPYLLSTQWVLSAALKWTTKHPLFISKVLGGFPEEGDNTLIPLGVCEEAKLRIVYPTESDRKVIGVDVARFGTDSTVLTYLHGDKFISKKVLVKRDLMQVSGEVIAECQTHGWPNVIVVDATGIGSGVVDALRESQNNRIIPGNVEIREVQFGAAPKCEVNGCDHRKDCDKAKYTNIKGRMFDLLAQDLRRGLSLPDEDIYLDELPTILYAYDSKGRMIIESKDEYKRRTGRGSPDHAVSLALANFATTK